MTSETYRLFVAAPLPAEVKTELAKWCMENKNSLEFQKWTYTEDYHITLKFMGDQAIGRIPEISKALSRAAEAFTPLPLRLSGAGVFGPPKAPSILWIGTDGNIDALKHLHACVEEELFHIGLPKENKPFRPHITAARRYTGRDRWNPDQIDSETIPGSKWTLERIVLYRSHLGKTPMYEELLSFPLLGSGSAAEQ